MVADAKIEAFGTILIGSFVSDGAHLGGAVGYQNDGSLSGYSLVSVHGYDADAGNNIGGFLGYGAGVAVSGYASGNVSGVSYTGGLVGHIFSGTINDSYATGNVSGSEINAGGLVGMCNTLATVNESYATGDVSGKENVGGLVGKGYFSTISGYATGDVTSTSHRTGGLAGHLDHSTISGYTTGNVSSPSKQIGGLAGQSDSSTVKGYATGNVTGGSQVGGLVGYLGGDGIVVGYATGNVTGDSIDIGGLVGLLNSNYSGTATGYWDKQSTGQATSSGGATVVGISKTQSIVFASANSYTDSGNSNPIFNLPDFIDIFDTTNGADKTWPKLKSDSFDLIQPTVSDLDDDGTIEVVY